MQRYMLIICSVCAIVTSLFIIHYHSFRQAAASSVIFASGCINIPASPDYLSSNDEHDAIAALNNAHQVEHLPALRLPDNFYQINPAQQQFILLNQERTDRGLQPLTMDANLSAMALAYSRQLRDLHFFSHTSPIAGTFGERINNNPSIANHYSLAAENLAGNPVAGIGPMYEYMYNDGAEACDHRKNILDPALTLIGINWVMGSEYGSISAQEFLASASWNPYVGGNPGNPDTQAPSITITVNNTTHSQSLELQALTENIADITPVKRITWFVDNLNQAVQTGPTLILNMQKLSHGTHTLFAYAVDGNLNYTVARYTIQV